MTQKLFTKEVLKQAEKFPMGSQDSKGDDAVVWAKFFDPSGRYTAYITEMDVTILNELGNKQMVEGSAFGYCVSSLGPDCDEYGYFDLEEMTLVKNRFGLGIERDMYWNPMTMGEVKAQLDERGHA